MSRIIYLAVVRYADGRAKVHDASLERSAMQSFCAAYNRTARRNRALGRASIERQPAQIGDVR